MNFNLNSEQQMLQDSVRRFVTKACSFENRMAQIKAGPSASARNWRAFAENGWLAAALPESYGGLGGTVVDNVLIGMELGRGLVSDPFVGLGVLAAQTLAACATDAQKEALLPRLAEGTLRIALACSEPDARGNPARVKTKAVPHAGGYALHGHKTLVVGAPAADMLLVSARIDGAGGDAGRVTLFLVEAGSAGLTQRALPLHDGTWAADVLLDGVQVSADARVGYGGDGLPALRLGLAHAVAAQSAELIGAMEAAIEATSGYLKVRKQFGVQIGSFQALQHRMADMAAEMELARSMLFALLAAFEGGDETALQYTASACKAFVCRAAKNVCGQAIQLHGGIGMTEEYAIGHYFKRAVVADLVFGSSDQHEAACAAALERALT
ncbi:acyl-CoA dehydrogenase family protein [Paraburkholderia tagetis]|uniref:Acyl-CoA dehydrogenase family protein n=1 Tax=Paraburkholderia tagetis TaxID=2913261 RepID=A0A9X1RRT7_9BURK|nr:acyl-CoA dehydrogenase family protein [Paraburkholderia tagetis]MCG5076168.1 acyl-CoA dehydrogenase family protein [Paraburkholderia tagetis]